MSTFAAIAETQRMVRARVIIAAGAASAVTMNPLHPLPSCKTPGFRSTKHSTCSSYCTQPKVQSHRTSFPIFWISGKVPAGPTAPGSKKLSKRKTGKENYMKAGVTWFWKLQIDNQIQNRSFCLKKNLQAS